MSIIKYHTTRGVSKIEKVIVDKETGRSVYMGNVRRIKHGGWDNYYDTFEEAKEALITYACKCVHNNTVALHNSEVFLHRVQSLKTEDVFVNK